MTAVFLKILNMSITGAVIAAAVLLLRPMLKRAPRALVCALWLLVGLRLLVPFTFESPLSLMPASDTVTESSDGSISVNTGIGFINSALSTPQTPPQSIILPEGFTPPADIPDSGEPSNGTVTIPEAEEGNESKRSVSAVDIAAIVWASGTVLMVIYAAVSYLRIRLRVRESVKVEKGIFICDRIDSPFILGVIRPRIYMPSDTPEGDTPYIISHERAHLKRLDHLWKPLGFLLLSLHWFNPVMWISYIMLCRDIELACDEKVIRAMGEEAKKPYSDALISASSPRRLISACPLAFGEIGVKRRIRAVLSYKKPTLWIIIAAVLALCIVAACFLTSRKADENEPPFCIEAQNSYSDMDGVWAEITKTDTENGKMTVVWHNDTEKELIFGEEFYIYRVEENGQTVDTYTFSEEFAWNLIGYPVAPNGTFEKEYALTQHDVRKDSVHRYETYFHISGDNPVPNGLEKYAVSVEFATSESFIPKSTKPAESDTPDLPTPDVLSNLEKVEAADDVKCTITLSGYTEQVTVEGDVAKALYREVASSITDNEKYFNVPSEQPSVGLSFTVNGFENSYYFRVFDNDTVQTELPIHTTICKGYALKSGSYEKVKAMVEEYTSDLPTSEVPGDNGFPVLFPESIEKVMSLDNFNCVISLDSYDNYFIVKNSDIFVKGEDAKTLYGILAEGSTDMELVSYPFTDNSNHTISLFFVASDNISEEEPSPVCYGIFHVHDNDTVSHNISPYMATYNYPAGTYEKVKAMVDKYTVGIPSEYHVGTWAKNAGQDYETLNISSLSNNAVSFSVTVSNQYKSIFIVEASAHEKNGKYYFGEDVSTKFNAPDGVSGYLEFTADGISMTFDSFGVMEGQAPFNNVYYYTMKLAAATANGISNSYDIIFEFTDYIVDTERNGFNDEGPAKGLLGLHEMLRDESANAVRNALFAYLYDLNGDGSNELIIAVNNLSDGTSPYFDGRVLAIYTADENSKGKLVFEGYSRNKAYHLENGDILIFASSGAANDSIGIYNLSTDGTTLECKEMYFREFDEVWHNTSGELDKENSKKLDMDAEAYAKLGEGMKNNLISVPFDSKYYSFSVDYFEPTDTYVCHDTKEAIPPSINLYSGAYFTFTYSYLSSYAPHGTYELTDETLTLRTSDGLYTYVFNVTPGDSLRFDSTRSSPLPKYKYSADAEEAEPPFGHGALFTKVLDSDDNINYIPTPEISIENFVERGKNHTTDFIYNDEGVKCGASTQVYSDDGKLLGEISSRTGCHVEYQTVDGENVVLAWAAYGTGPAARQAVFYRTSDGKVSEEFNYYLDSANGLVVYGLLDGVMVRHIFDKDRYSKKFDTFEMPISYDYLEPFVNAVISDDGKLIEITYRIKTDDGLYSRNTETFELE